jgi:hypothetical protein
MEAKMKPIYDEYIESAEKLMEMLQNKESIAWYLVSKQFDFTHSLFALRDIDVPINYAIGGLILAYFDELAEAQEWIRQSADDTDKQLEIAFEGIDASLIRSFKPGFCPVFLFSFFGNGSMK